MPLPSLPSLPSSPKPGRARSINSRTVVAPLAAFTMALLLLTYSRTSIRAAKANAQRHREADSGGEGLSLVQENRRRHGLAQRVDGSEGGTVGELVGEMMGKNKKAQGKDGGEGKGGGVKREEEEKIRALRGGRRKGSAAEDR